MKKFIFYAALVVVFTFFAQSELLAAEASYGPRGGLAHVTTDEKAPVVYFTKDVSAEGLMKVYEAAGRAADGKTAIKLTFGAQGDPLLSPAMLKPLRDKLNAMLVDSNGLTPPRHETAGHMRLIRDHGFAAIGPVEVLDADGELDIPVSRGKLLKFHRTGSRFAKYDSVVSVVRFKPHRLRDYGGAIKNITICLATPSGKCNIHSAGRTASSYSPADDDDFLEAMAEAAKAALDYKKDKWVFINVLQALEPDDLCAGTTAMPDIGVIASVDPVAADQAAIDMTYKAAPDAATRSVWEQSHNTRVLEYAQNTGAGRRDYRLVELD